MKTQKILKKFRKLDPLIRYWIFMDYIRDFGDLDYLQCEIEYQKKKREKQEDNCDERVESNEGWIEFEPGKFIYDEMAANP